MSDDSPKAERLTSESIEERIATLTDWTLTGESIRRTYALPGFRAALAFVQLVGELAEARDHHPDIDIRYNKVTLTLSTHSVGGLTEKDFELAGMIDSRQGY